jgi:hypothetical protein
MINLNAKDGLRFAKRNLIAELDLILEINPAKLKLP